MSVLPEFSFERSVSAEEAKHDKITLHVRHRRYQGTHEDIDAFRNFLAVPPAAAGSSAAAGVGQYYGKIFNRPSETGTFWKPLEIRRRRRSHIGVPVPLFAGKYKFSSRPPDSEDAVLIETALELFLNPTRFLRNQDADYIPPRLNFASTSATFYESSSVNEGDEFSLDRADNWIPNLPTLQQLHKPGFWRRNVRNYLEGVIREIDQDTERAATLTEVQVAFEDVVAPDRFNLKEVETYFDFAVPAGTAIDRVQSFEPLLQGFSELDQTAKDYPVHGWNANSRVLTVAIASGVKLTIYAKTNKRIRFEVTHDLRHARFPVSGQTGKRRMRHTTAALGGVYTMLDRLRADAAEIVNRVIRHMRSQASLPATPKTGFDLLLDIAKAIGNAENARTLVSVLLHKGSITSQPQLQSALQKLRRAGILRTQPQNRRREYVVTEQYQHPLQMLRAHSAFPHLTARHRTRISTQSG